MVDGLQREVHCHKFNNWLQAHEGSTACQTSKAGLGDWSVHYSVPSELFEESLGDLVSAIVLGHFLTDQEHLTVSLELLTHRLVQGLSVGQLHLHP